MDRYVPLLIAEGFALFPFPYMLVRRHFRKRGRDVAFVPFAMKNMGDVTVYAESIVRVADDALCRSADGKFDLLGFSMGGVAGLYAVKRLGLAPYVRNFIAVGAPFRGTKLAYLGLPTLLYSPTGFQLMPESPFLGQLHMDPLPPGPRYVSIAGDADMVCPPKATRLDGAKNIPLAFRHIDLVFARDLYATIDSFLE